MALLGVLVSANAIISVIQHGFQIGLVPYLADLVSYYRQLTTPLFDVLYWPLETLFHLVGWRLAIPLWFQDLHLLSFIGGGLIGRGLANERVIGGYWGGIVVGLIYGLIGFGLVLLFFVLMGMLIPGTVHQSVQLRPNQNPVVALATFNAVKFAIGAGWATIGAVVLFYVLNSGTALVTP